MIVDFAVYENGRRRADITDIDILYETCHAEDTFAWIGLHEPTPEEFEAVRAEFDLHELSVADAMGPHQRPKIEAYEDSLFVVFKTAHYDEEHETVEIGEIDMFVGPHYVVHVRRGKAAPLTGARAALEAEPDRLALGPLAVLHSIAATVVSEYLPVATGLDNDIIEVEEQVFSDGRRHPTERIYFLKREVLGFHNATAPFVEVLEKLMGEHVVPVPDDLRLHVRDTLDDLLRVNDQVGTLRELLTSVLEANLAQVAVQQNDDMRTISAWVAIAAVPTMVSGIYGMNFAHMPLLDDHVGMPAALGFTLIVCAVLWSKFRSAGWL